MDYPISVPGVGLSAGKFTNGNPLASLAASLDPAEWANNVTDSIVKVQVAGGLTASENNTDQLRDAIWSMIRGGDHKDSVRVASTVAINLAAPGANIDGVAMVAGDRFLEKDHGTASSRGIYIWNGAAVAATRALDADSGAELNSGVIIPVESGTANADTNWQLTTDGTVIIGTTALAFASFGSQTFASNAEAQAFAVTNKSITPSTLAAAFQAANQSLAANGYQRLPGGLILQWGLSASIASDGSTVVTLPITFPNACLVVVATPKNTAGTGGDVTSAQLVSFTTSQLTLYLDSNAASRTMGMQWFAIGY